MFFFFKQKTAYEMRISDWSSDVCSSDLSASACCGRSTLTPTQAGLSRHDRRTIIGIRWDHAFDVATHMQTQFVFDNRDIRQPTGSASYDGPHPSFKLRCSLFPACSLFEPDIGSGPVRHRVCM